MSRGRYPWSTRKISAWFGAIVALVVAGPRIGSTQGTTPAADVSPLSDSWKGNTLDPKWHVTLVGDAQTQENKIEVNDGTIKITAGGSEWFDVRDNGLFLWQPANGDFQATIEIRTLKKISESSKVGIMVRPDMDKNAPYVYALAMPKGTHLQGRTAVGENAGPSSGDAGRLPWGDLSGDGPTMWMRLTRTGNSFKCERSFDGKTFGRVHDDDHKDPDTDVMEVVMPDDVLVGIAVTAISLDVGTTDPTEAVVGPFQFTQIATRPTTNGLLAATVVDANGSPVPDGFLIVKKGTEVVGTTKNEVTDPATSNTGSFFLAPGLYTIEAGETDTNAAGTPVPFEVKTGKTEDLKVKAGAAK
jgi:hypothetical protein